MEPENKYDEVLIRYLLNEGNAEEEKFILEWVNASESNRMYLQSLSNILKLVAVKEEINKINIDQEWQHFQQLKAAEQQKVFHINEQVTGDAEMLLEENRSRKARIYRLFIVGAVAASLIFAVLMGLGLFNSDKGEKPVTVKNEKGTGGKIDSLMVVMLHEENTSGKVKRISLPDGSEINLYTNSELTYREPSEGDKREVFLKGKADFKVAKDKTRPFTVFSGVISTTALGTQFTVTAMPHEKQILVRLNEGKVVVRSTKAHGSNSMKDMYLIPGQELVYDVIRETAIVRSFATSTETANESNNNDKRSDDIPAVPNYDKKSWFMFNNQSLSEIFDALAGMYNVKIIYSKKDIKKMYFIGTFDKSDSIEFILRQIASINNLEVTKNSNTYRIKKQLLKQNN